LRQQIVLRKSHPWQFSNRGVVMKQPANHDSSGQVRAQASERTHPPRGFRPPNISEYPPQHSPPQFCLLVGGNRACIIAGHIRLDFLGILRMRICGIRVRWKLRFGFYRIIVNCTQSLDSHQIGAEVLCCLEKEGEARSPSI